MASTKRVVGKANKIVAEVLAEKATAAGVRHEDLGKKSGIPRSSISKLLAGNMVMSLDQLSLICIALNIPASTIVAEAESRLKTKATAKQPARRARLLQAPKPKMLDTSNLAVAAKQTPYSLEDEIEQTYND